MSTKYYLRDIQKYNEREELMQSLFKALDEKLSDTNIDYTHIRNSIQILLEDSLKTDTRIAMTSHGWKPLFYCNNHIRSVVDLENFYHDNVGTYVIVDEYNDELTWIEFEKRVIMHCKDGRPHGYVKDSQGYEFTWYD